MDRARQFYGETLGLAALGDWEGGAEYDAGNVAIAVVQVPATATLGGATSGWKNGVIAFSVPDVTTAVEDLRAKGVPVLWEATENPPCHLAMVEDPFGNRIALHHRKDGTPD